MGQHDDQQSFTLELDDGTAIHGIARWPTGSPEPRPTVVICHGFKGFLEWGFFPPLADLLVERGFTTIRFNFPGTGMRPGDELVTDLAAFRGALPSQDVEHLLAVLDAVGAEIAPGHADPDRLSLVGHSRGGGAVLLAAARDAWRDRLRALVTWNGVSTFDRWPPTDKERWRRDGELVILNGRTGQELPIGVEVLDDIEGHPGIDLPVAAGRRTVPWLIVHGADDPVVPLAEAELLASKASGVHELEAVAGGDHTLGARHPFAGPTPALITALNATQSWLMRHGR